MLGGNLPGAALFQNSKLYYLYEIHLFTYTETIQEEQKKKGLMKQFYATTI